jgi:hypothetical protein
VLVEIEPEGGRRHNSPLTSPPPSEADTAEGPLGGEGKHSMINSTFTKQNTQCYD